MQNRAAGIVIKDDQLLLMRRSKFGHLYYVIPGGSVEPDETFPEAAVRELWEETRIKAEPTRLLYRHEFDTGKIQEYYLMKYIEGTPQLEESEEQRIMNNNNTFDPLFIPITELSKLPILPPSLKKSLLNDLPDNLPKSAKTLNLLEEKEFIFFKELDRISIKSNI